MRSSIFFAERRKKRAWNTWKQYDKLVDMLDYISVWTSQKNLNKALPTLEKFVVFLYDRKSTCPKLNVGKIYFPEKGDYQKNNLLL